MFEIKLRAWQNSLEAHRQMEAFLTEKLDVQYELIDSLQDKWHGAAANMFRYRYLFLLREGKCGILDSTEENIKRVWM